MATINDVARKAGVSVATVSYVLNGKDRVSAQSERRVKRAIEALHYTPSGTARKLKLGRSSIIGFVADNIANRFPAHLVQGLANAATAQGYAVLISDLHDDPSAERRALDLLVHEQVEAIVYCGFGAAEDRLLRIHRAGTPVVVVDKPPVSPLLPSVLIDNAGSLTLALDHLLALGHRELRFISGDPNNRNTALRNEAFNSFLCRHGLPVSPAHILMGTYSLQHGYETARRLVNESPAFTAVVCGDDMIAFGAIAGFKSCRLRIPEDVAVVGFADDPLAGVMDPGLTTIHYPMVEMGQRAFEVFRSLRDSGSRSIPHEELVTSLVVRRSTDPACRPFALSPLTEQTEQEPIR